VEWRRMEKEAIILSSSEDIKERVQKMKSRFRLLKFFILWAMADSILDLVPTPFLESIPSPKAPIKMKYFVLAEVICRTRKYSSLWIDNS
jgi:hypothetical protein